MDKIYIKTKRPIKIGLIRASLIAIVCSCVAFYVGTLQNASSPPKIVKEQHCTPEQVSNIIQSRLQIALDGGYANVPYPEVKP